MKKQKAFSLLELGVVLVIIGVLVAGLIQGGNLLKISRLSGARSLTVKSVVPKIPGLVAWYETSLKDSFNESQSYDGAQLSAWYDISAGSFVKDRNKLTRVASSSVLYEDMGINKIPSVSFSGSVNFTLTEFYQGTSSQNTIFVVVRPSLAQGVTEQVILDSGNSGIAAAFGTRSTALWVNVGIQVTASTTFTQNQNYIIAVYYNSSNSRVFSNDTSTMAGGATINPGSNRLTGLTIGSTRTATKPFNGFISEIIIYNRPLNSQERKDVMTYLSKKYRIAVTGI